VKSVSKSKYKLLFVKDYGGFFPQLTREDGAFPQLLSRGISK
jgi:hypothetical protein